MGEAPDWYFLIRAARYLNVAPWELLAQPDLWTDMALSAQAAETAAANDLHGGS